MDKNTRPLIVTVLVGILFTALCVAGREMRDDVSAGSGPIAHVQSDDLSSITPPAMATGSRRSLSASVSGWRDGGDRVAWNFNCDFNGPVKFELRTIPPERCGTACSLYAGHGGGIPAKCTHFVHRDGVCFLKNYSPGDLNGPNYPVTWNEPNRICGFIAFGR